MCGIFAALLQAQCGNKHITTYKNLLRLWSNTTHRGPDEGKMEFVVPKTVIFGFHRLCINGLDSESGQPIEDENRRCSLICNGEIYNTEELKLHMLTQGVKMKSRSDCEVIVHLYLRYGIAKTLDMLDGVFGLALYDRQTQELHVARDLLGIRPLFWSCTPNDSPCNTPVQLALASEAKSLLCMRDVQQFPPGTWRTWKLSSADGSLLNTCGQGLIRSDVRHAAPPFDASGVCGLSDSHGDDREHERLAKLRQLFHTAVRKRLLLSDRPVGCLLSGGLDSTLVAAVLMQEMRKAGAGKLNTYSIGMPGSVDLRWARVAADYLGTEHHEICLTEADFLNAIPRTVWHTESFDTTTIRASVGNLLISEYIRDLSEDVVIFVGDVADELFASYRGFCQAPDRKSFFDANRTMLFDIHQYDVLRSDRTISSAGLEARVPFADLDLMLEVLQMDPGLKMFHSGGVAVAGGDNNQKNHVMEKHVLRRAFEGYLPKDLLYRRKEAFSDGVSSDKRDWFVAIREHVDPMFSEADLKHQQLKDISSGLPRVPDKESLWYRQIYDSYFAQSMPNPFSHNRGYWRHPFCDVNADPSARLLDCY